MKREWHEALFFFQLALITAGRMAELRRMRWEESDVRFGTVKIYSSKTKNGAPSKRLPQRLLSLNAGYRERMAEAEFSRSLIIGSGTF